MNRVAVTGMGVITPLGNQLEVFRDNLLAGRSGIGPLSLFPAGSLPSRIVGECDIEEAGPYKDRKINFALQAAQSALEQANLHGTAAGDVYPTKQRALGLGTGLELFDMKDLVSFTREEHSSGDTGQPSIDFLQTPADWCAHLLVKQFLLSSPPAIHISACAAGADAIGHAFLRIRRGEISMALAGGTDSMLNPMGLGGFCKLDALSTRNHEPAKASRPFDSDRDGFVLAEGAGMVVLENLEQAQRRGACIYAEITGYGNSFDAYAVSEPHPEGRGAVQAMERAVAMAGIQARDISYINAHGTSTPKNDPVETLAIKKLLGDDAYKVPISSTKSMTGHLISAAGAVEAIAAITCANAGYVHPTINLDNPDPACDLDYVPHTARRHKVTHFLCNSFAFGGQNTALVFRNWEE